MERARSRILNDDELRTVWSTCEGTFGALVKMALLTAQRREKLATMQLTDIVNGEWRIRWEPREKTNAGTLKLPQTALDIIEAQPQLAGNPHVFAGRGETAFNSFSQRHAELFRKLPGMPHWVFHDLRRTARSLMSRAKVSSEIAERVLGHALVGVEGVYDRHSYLEEKAEALEKLSRLIETILNPPTDNVVDLRGQRFVQM